MPVLPCPPSSPLFFLSPLLCARHGRLVAALQPYIIARNPSHPGRGCRSRGAGAHRDRGRSAERRRHLGAGIRLLVGRWRLGHDLGVVVCTRLQFRKRAQIPQVLRGALYVHTRIPVPQILGPLCPKRESILRAIANKNEDVFPNDEQEQDREDMKHAMTVAVCGDKLHFAPIGENPSRILDLGTGTGIWCVDMGDAYPMAEVIGVDLSPIQPTFVPPNGKRYLRPALVDRRGGSALC